MDNDKKVTQKHLLEDSKSTHSHDHDHKNGHSHDHSDQKSSQLNNQTWLDYWHKLNKFLEKYLLKEAPAIPPKAKQIIVQILPIVILIGVILQLFAFISSFIWGGLFIALSGYALAATNTLGNFISLLLGLVASVLEIIALPGLFEKNQKGWRFLYYSVLVTLVGSILSLNIFGVVIGVLSLYLIFQIKSYYK
jgi:hypothetical protein